MTSDLRVALTQGQLAVHYQPIIDLLTGKVREAEAPIRWTHPVRGGIDPADFISMARGNGLIVDIGKWVLNQALDQFTQRHAMLDNTLQMLVNKSSLEFRAYQSNSEPQPKVVERRGFAPYSLAVETIEGSLMASSAEVVKYLYEFRRAGVDIASGDFGTGYSSSSYPKRFDTDFIKIDQLSVCNLTHNPKDIALYSAIISIVYALHIKVIAEGIEIEEQKAILVAIGYDYGQGHLFCPPIPPAALESFVINGQLTEA